MVHDQRQIREREEARAMQNQRRLAEEIALIEKVRRKVSSSIASNYVMINHIIFLSRLTTR